jgi:methylenetetrahydrofolate reductase (NADPH)
MSFPASATDTTLHQAALAELVTGGSLEISPRELHRAGEVAGLVPANTCIYIPSLPGLPLSRTLEAVRALRAAGLDPVPHVSARRILDRDEFRDFLRTAAGEHGVHRVLLIGGDEPRAKGPYADSLEVLESGVLRECGIREIGVSGYPEGHPRIALGALDEALRRKVALAREQDLGVYVVTQFCFVPARVVEYCAAMARAWPQLGIYIGVAGPADPVALARYAQRCGVSVSLRALRNLGSGIAKLMSHKEPLEQLHALARYNASRGSSNVVGVHLYSFGGAVRTATWMREFISA